MDTVKVEIELPKEMAAIKEAIGKMVGAVKTSLADGWQPGTDLPAILIAGMAELPAAIAGLSSLPAEFKADKGKAVVVAALILDQYL